MTSARGGQVLAIYDDHDFLGNNRYGGDHSAALRESACVEFIRAFAPPQTGQNVYHLRRVGPADIVVLDERFYRQAPSVSASDRDAVLGSAQWNWLEQVVAASDASYLVVASSTTPHTFRAPPEPGCAQPAPRGGSRKVAKPHFLER